MALYPVNLQLKNRLCLVVGGGGVALRKVRGLLLSGALVRVISPEIVPELNALAGGGQIQLLARPYQCGDLRDAFLVFAATDNRTVQEAVRKDAEKYGVLINCADDPTTSDFHVPAHFRRGNVLVTISTGGSSPALARRLRERLEAEVGHDYGNVATILGLIRSEIVALDNNDKAHAALFNRLLDLKLCELVQQKQWGEVENLLQRELPAGCDGSAIFQRFLNGYDNSPSGRLDI